MSRLKTVFAAALVVALCAAGARAQEEPVPPPTGPAVQPAAPPTEESAAPTAPTPSHAMTQQDVETFFDGMIPYALKRADIAGATVSVVKDGQTLFAKGYGFANLEKRTPVVADKTLFRPGSISKVFTWTAVMQMVEQGKLDLDKDINTYLDFKIPDAFGAPITMRQIMAHSAGFEELAEDLFVYEAKDLYPLGDYLKKNIPARIYPPGKIVAYSNYATALAGYVVERLSGEPFADYLANHIFKPLAMTRSTFAQPLPKELEADMSLGYKQASDGKAIPFELVESAPAGALSSTATDMARFMIAQLGGGDGVTPVLKPETLKLMFTQTYHWAPGINGFAHGYYEEDRNGHRIVGHAGDTIPFHSDHHLMVNDKVGFFISFNCQGKEGEAGKARTAIFRAFLDRYFPYTQPKDPPYTVDKDEAKRIVGSYVSTRRKESALRLLWLIGQTSVTAEANGDVKVDALKDESGATKLWRPIAPLRYREVGGQAQLVFVADEKTGRINYFTTDEFISVLLFQRAADLEQSSLFVPLTLGTLGVFALTFVIWIGGWILRWRYGQPLEMTSRQFVWRLASRLGVVLFLAVVIGWLGFLTMLQADDTLLFGGKAAQMMSVLYVIGVAAVIGGVAIIINAAQRLTGGPGGILARGGELVLALAAAYGIWAMVNYGLLSFSTVI